MVRSVLLPGKGDKSAIKKKNSFNSTMTASSLLAIVSKENKQRKICLLFQCITNSHRLNPEKKREKNIKMTFLNVGPDRPTYRYTGARCT